MIKLFLLLFPAEWRVLGAVEAVTGILMFGWSTGVLFSVVNHLTKHFSGSPGAGYQPG